MKTSKIEKQYTSRPWLKNVKLPNVMPEMWVDFERPCESHEGNFRKL